MPDESIPLSVIVGELSSSHVTLMFGSGILVYNIKYQIIMAPIQVLFTVQMSQLLECSMAQN